MAELHTLDEGTILYFSVTDGVVAVDLGPATTKQIKFVKPDSTQATQTLAFSQKSGDAGDGSDGRLQFVIPTGFLDQSGTWSCQLYFVMPSWTGHSDTLTFTVSTNLF